MSRFAPVVSKLAQKTMRVAFDNLQRAITPADVQKMRSVSSIGQVREAALRLENELAARQSLRNMRRLAPLLNGMEHYGKVVEVLCNGTLFLSWIWAPITLILRVASEFIEAFELIMKGYAKIAETLVRFEVLNEAFANNLDFQQSLACYYADILQFHKEAYVFVRRNSWKLLFTTSWGRFERRFDNLLEDLDRHGRLIDLEANARNIAEARQMRQELQAWKETSLMNIEKEEKQQKGREFEAILTWLKVDETEQEAILEAVAIERTQYPGTSNWILRNDKIKSWLLRKPETPFLWMHGTPGTGKSVLLAELVNFLQSSDASVVHHFCTYTYASSTKYDGILRSVVLQILRNHGDLVNHVYQEYVLNRRPTTINTLERLLHTLVDASSHQPRQPEYIWIVIDGLNECEISKQQKLVSLLNHLASAQSDRTVVKVLIATRQFPNLSKRLLKNQVFSLGDHEPALSSAIRTYVSCRLKLMESYLQQIEPDEEKIEEIVTLITKKSNGMFLYARLVLDHIKSNIFMNGRELKSSIEQLPQELADFYNKLLMQIIKNMDELSRDRVETIFSWIAFAKRPLKKMELLSALTFSNGIPDPDNLAPAYILDETCSPLLSQRHDMTLTFIHVTVKDFLQSSNSFLPIQESDSMCRHSIATTCCLLSGLQVFSTAYDHQTRLLRLVKGLHAFHVYATEYWTEYILSASTDSSKASMMLTLANELAKTLESNAPAPSVIDDLDERLATHILLQKHVGWALQARSQKRLEQEIFAGQEDSIDLIKDDGVSVMLSSYQRAVECVLELDNIPGASAEELDIFKSQFGATAFTCRLHSCPRATLGFDSAKLRHEHELTHSGGIKCSVAECQFPTFKNIQALRKHHKKHHESHAGWRPIRRIQNQKLRPSTVSSHSADRLRESDLKASNQAQQIASVSGPVRGISLYTEDPSAWGAPTKLSRSTVMKFNLIEDPNDYVPIEEKTNSTVDHRLWIERTKNAGNKEAHDSSGIQEDASTDKLGSGKRSDTTPRGYPALPPPVLHLGISTSSELQSLKILQCDNCRQTFVSSTDHRSHTVNCKLERTNFPRLNKVGPLLQKPDPRVIFSHQQSTENTREIPDTDYGLDRFLHEDGPWQAKDYDRSNSTQGQQTRHWEDRYPLTSIVPKPGPFALPLPPIDPSPKTISDKRKEMIDRATECCDCGSTQLSSGYSIECLLCGHKLCQHCKIIFTDEEPYLVTPPYVSDNPFTIPDGPASGSSYYNDPSPNNLIATQQRSALQHGPSESMNKPNREYTFSRSAYAMSDSFTEWLFNESKSGPEDIHTTGPVDSSEIHSQQESRNVALIDWQESIPEWQYTPYPT